MPSILHFVVWPAAVGAFYSLHGWMKERRSEGRMALDSPQLVILIGLVIALIGVGWQLIRPPSVVEPPQRVEGEAVGPVEPKPVRHYSVRDKDQISDALSELSQILNQDVLPLFEDGQAILLNFHKDKDFDVAISALKEREATIVSINERLHAILEKNIETTKKFWMMY